MKRIFKFGGECSTIEFIYKSINLILHYGFENIYLFSATANYTNSLMDKNYNYIDEYHHKLADALKIDLANLPYFQQFLSRNENYLFLAVGELLTVEIIGEYLKQNNSPVGFVNGIWTLGYN